MNLDAMGDVLMTTAQLPAIKRLYPQSTIEWITLPSAAPLLAHNPFLYATHPWNDETRMILSRMEFDLLLNADKSRSACAFAGIVRAKEKRGFLLNSYGQIVPANREAEYNHRLGLDDHLKFRVNTKTGQEILGETWCLPYRRDEYILELTEAERSFCTERRSSLRIGEEEYVVGFNTGCSDIYPNKKMTVEQHIELIGRLLDHDGIRVLLLGGREDTERNERIVKSVGPREGRLINTPTTEGLRKGLCYINLADVVVTGDSFGMHAAIALRKQVLVWFGVSCWSEIDLYDRGRKFYQEDLDCSPCWKRECPFDLECIRRIDLDGIESAIREMRK